MTGTVRVGIASATTTLWFDGSSGWEVPYRNGIQARYGEELALEIQLVTRGSPSEIRSQLVQLRSLVRTIDRGGGTFLVDDGSAVETYAVRSAQLQDVSERLPLWPAGFAEVRLLLACDAESVSSTATTLLERRVTQTGEPVVVDPEGPAQLGIRVRPDSKPLPPALEAYVFDGEYSRDDLVISFDTSALQGDIYTYRGQYTAAAPEVDIYAEVSDNVGAPNLAITAVRLIPPYERLLAMPQPPGALAGDWQSGDIFIVWSSTLSSDWQNNGGVIQVKQLTGDTTTVPIPPSKLVIALRQATFLKVIRGHVRNRLVSYPSSGGISISATETLPPAPSGYTYLLLGYTDAGYAMYAYDWEAFAIKCVEYQYGARPRMSGFSSTGYALHGTGEEHYRPVYFEEWTGASQNLTFEYATYLGDKPKDFAWIDIWLSYECAVLAIPTALFSSITAGTYRVAVAAFRASEPVALVHYEDYVYIQPGHRVRVEFDSRSPDLTHKVYLQRVGLTQWYSTSASPPGITLSSVGTAENLPNVPKTGIRKTISVSIYPEGVQYPRQQRSASYVSGGRKLVPIGRFSLHPNQTYTVTVEKRDPALLRLWALPRPRALSAGAYVIRSALLEAVRENGRPIFRATDNASISADINVGHSYIMPWLMLRLASYAQSPQAVLATDWNGSGFPRGSTTASPLRKRYPGLGVPLIAVNLSSSKVPIAYYNEGDYSSQLASGRTIHALVFLHNPGTSSVTCTIYLDNASNTSNTVSTTITLSGGEYTIQPISLTLTSAANHVAVAVTGTSGALIYANVLWTSAPLQEPFGRRSFYRDTWYYVQPAYPEAGPRLFGWNVHQLYIYSTYGSYCTSPGPHIGRNITGSSANGTYISTSDPAYFVVAGQPYTISMVLEGTIPSGYTVTARFLYPGGAVSHSSTTMSSYTFTPTSDGWCQLELIIVKNSSSSISICALFRNLSRGTTVGNLRTLTAMPAETATLSIAWRDSSSSWALALRAVWQDAVVSGKFGEIPLASGSPLELWFGSGTIEVRRAGSTLVSVTRPSTIPSTILVGYDGTTLTLRVGSPGSWITGSATASLPEVTGAVTLSGADMGGEFGVRWLALVNGPSEAFLSGTPSKLGYDDAYPAVLEETSYTYWYADEPYYVYRPGGLVLGVQRGVLEVNGKATLVLFPVTSLEERTIVDRSFAVDVLAYDRR
jgi:hypothetical protein